MASMEVGIIAGSKAKADQNSDRTAKGPTHIKMEPASRSPEKWAEIFPRYPETPDGYVLSYSHDDPEGYRAAMERYGFAVVRALPEDICRETVDAMLGEVNFMQRSDVAKARVRLTDPSTWEDCNWPSASKFLFDRPTVCASAWRVRLHPNVRRIFRELYEMDWLVSSVDKWLFARGTRNITIRDPDTGEIVAMERIDSWEQSLPMHVHLDPWRYMEEQRKAINGDGEPDEESKRDDPVKFLRSFMGVVALVDCPKEVGGHVTLPGGTAFLDVWAKENAEKMPQKPVFSYYVDSKDKVFRKYKQSIPLRMGEMVIWDMRQFHGTFSNKSSSPRVAQFVRHIPAQPWFQMTDRFSPAVVFKKWPELKDETAKILDELQCTEEERRIAGILSCHYTCSPGALQCVD